MLERNLFIDRRILFPWKNLRVSRRGLNDYSTIDPVVDRAASSHGASPEVGAENVLTRGFHYSIPRAMVKGWLLASKANS